MTINPRRVVVVSAADTRKPHKIQAALPPLAPPDLAPPVEDEDPPELFSAGFDVVEAVDELVSFFAACLYPSLR